MSVAMEDMTRRHRITVDEYHRMAEVGVLAPDARVELIEGVIVEMAPISPRHAGAVRQLTRLLQDAVGSRASVSCRLPVELSEYSEPQPDFSLLIPRDDFYDTQHPSVKDALLLIEVSDSTARPDLRTKAALYARHGVAELWVIDVTSARINVFRQPTDAAYRETFSTNAAESMTIEALPGVVVDLSRMLG